MHMSFHVGAEVVIVRSEDGHQEQLELPKHAARAMAEFARALMEPTTTIGAAETLAQDEICEVHPASDEVVLPSAGTDTVVSESRTTESSAAHGLEHDSEDVDHEEAVEEAQSREGFVWVGEEWRDLTRLWSCQLLELLAEALRELGLNRDQAHQTVGYWRDRQIDLAACYPSVAAIVEEIGVAEAYEAEHPQEQVEQQAIQSSGGSQKPQAIQSSGGSQKPQAGSPGASSDKRPKGPAEQLRQRYASLQNKLRDDGVPDSERDAILRAVRRGDFSDPRLARYSSTIQAIREYQGKVGQSASRDHAQQSPAGTKELARVVKLRLHHDLGLEFSACDRLLKDLSAGAAIWAELEKLPEDVRARTLSIARDLAARRRFSQLQSQPAATETTSMAVALLAAGLHELPTVAGDQLQEDEYGRTGVSATAANGHAPQTTEEQHDADTSESAQPGELDEQALISMAPTFDREAYEDSPEYRQMRKLMHNRTGAIG